MRHWCFLLVLLWICPAWSQPTTLDGIRAEINGLVHECYNLGNRPFDSKWPNGNVKEKYFKQPDGTWSYTRFYPTGGFAVKAQKQASGALVYEHLFSNGQTSALLRKDERITDYTSYWDNGEKKAKYQYSRHTNQTFYQAKDKDGKVVYPVR